MKKLVLCVVLCMASACMAGEWVLNYEYLSDLENDLFNDAQGGSVQYRIPIAGGLSAGLSAGYLTVDVDDQSSSTGSRCRRMLQTLDGDVTDVPLGISAIYALDINSSLRAVLDTGFKLHLLDSDLTYTETRRRGRRSRTESQSVDIDNALTYHVGGVFEWLLKDTDACQIAAAVGGGYAWDLDSDQLRVAGQNMPFDNSMEGCYLTAGVVIRTN